MTWVCVANKRLHSKVEEKILTDTIPQVSRNSQCKFGVPFSSQTV